MPKDPWAKTTTEGGNITIVYTPGDEASTCDEIWLIQSVKIIATIDGKDKVLKPSETPGLPADVGKDMDAEQASDGTTIDNFPGEKDPAMNGHDDTDNGERGFKKKDGSTKDSNSKDGPDVVEPWPKGMTKIRLEFEVAAFCAAGDDVGQFFACMTWVSEQEKGKKAKATKTGWKAGDCSQGFKDSLKKWEKQHKSPLPKPPYLLEQGRKVGIVGVQR